MVKKKATQVKKKKWRRQIDSQPVLNVLKDETAAAQAVGLDDKSLFFTDTQGSQRLKRKADSYPKQFYHPKPQVKTSKAVLDKVQTILSKRRPRNKPPSNVFDLWSEDKPNAREETTKSHIPAVVPPLAGQSYNPKTDDREQVLSRVVEEEYEELKRIEDHEKFLNSYVVVDNKPSTPEESDEDGEVDYIKNPVVSAERKLTEKQRRDKIIHQEVQKMQKSQAAERKRLKELDQIPSLINKNKAEAKLKKELKIKQEALSDLKKHEETLGLSAPKFRMGTFTYKAPLTEADLTGESSSALRKIDVKGNLVETFLDSVTRRKLVDRDEGRPKRPVREVFKQRWSGEVSGAIQAARKKRKLDEASGSIGLPKTSQG